MRAPPAEYNSALQSSRVQLGVPRGRALRAHFSIRRARRPLSQGSQLWRL